MRTCAPLAWLTTLLLFVGVAACGADQETSPLRMLGTVGVTVSDGSGAPGQVGFAFATETLVDDDKGDFHDGRLAGHCTMHDRGNGHWALDLGLSRPGADDAGLRSWGTLVEDAAVGPRHAQAEVTLDLGGDKYTGLCASELTAFQPLTGTAGISLTCESLQTDASSSFVVASQTDLEISGCVVQ